MTKALQAANYLLNQNPAKGTPPRAQMENNAAEHIVGVLLGDKLLVEEICEASIHRSARSRVWQAVFTGPSGGQVWRSTGLTDRTQPLLVARQWEAEARAERARVGRTARRPIWRVRRSEPFTEIGPMTQREVATLLGISERAVREIERRAIQGPCVLAFRRDRCGDARRPGSGNGRASPEAGVRRFLLW